MNETIRENGLFPTHLVFGVIPRFPVITDIAAQRERMELLAAAQEEMNTMIAE